MMASLTFGQFRVHGNNVISSLEQLDLNDIQKACILSYCLLETLAKLTDNNQMVVLDIISSNDFGFKALLNHMAKSL